MNPSSNLPFRLSPVSALWMVIALAAFLRLWGISYGLPHVYWTDEYHEVMRAMELGSGGFNLERTGKGGFYLLLFLEYGLYFVALKLTGVIHSTREFAELFVKDPSAFYLIGRITAAAVGCATVGFVYALGRQGYRAGVGLVAALFLAVNILHVDLSHRVGVDVPMTLFATMALYFGVRIAQGGSRRDYVIAGLCAALATTTKLPGIVVLLPLLIAHGYNVRGRANPIAEWISSRDVWIAFFVFFAVWVATNPGIVIASDYFSLFTSAPDTLAEDMVEGAVRPNLWLYYLDAMRESMGWPLALTSVAGVAYAAWRRTPADVMLLAYAAINYVAISSTTSEWLYFPRYTLPIIVVLAVLGARGVLDALERVPGKRIAAILAMAVLAGVPLAGAMQYSMSLTRPDTRTQAKAWIESNIPPGSRVLIEGGKISASRLTVPLEDSRDSLERRIEYWSETEPRQAKYLALKREVHAGGGYDLELVKVKAVEPFEEYVGRGVDFFVVRPDFFTGSRKAASGSAELLAELRRNEHVRLLEQFSPEALGSQGPVIEVYAYSRPGTDAR